MVGPFHATEMVLLRKVLSSDSRRILVWGSWRNKILKEAANRVPKRIAMAPPIMKQVHLRADIGHNRIAMSWIS